MYPLGARGQEPHNGLGRAERAKKWRQPANRSALASGLTGHQGQTPWLVGAGPGLARVKSPRPVACGFVLIELLFVVGLCAVLSAMAIPSILAGIDRARAAAAARYMAQQCGAARLQAVTRTAVVALRFRERQGEYEIEMFVDRNRNGVRTADIESGIDILVKPAERLSTSFPGVRIGIAPELGIGDDPVRVGASGLLSFTPLGTATAGSIYIVGKDRSQFAVRVLGATARTRLQQYDAARRVWVDR